MARKSMVMQFGMGTDLRGGGRVPRCTQLDWMFWDSAYRLERWPVAIAPG
jgi:hypothetical protein